MTVGSDEVPSCETVKVSPAITIVPVRDVAPVWAATVYVIVPFPVPRGEGRSAAVTVIQLAALDAVHGHPACVVTATLSLPPTLGND